MAKNDFLSWDTTAGNNSDIGGIGILGTNAVNNFDDAFRTLMAQLRRDIDGEVVWATKTTNYSSTANDNNAFHRFTATANVQLVSAATLGAGWHYTVTAVGASTSVTFDPAGSETIGGALLLTIRGGQTVFIISDGTNFQVEIRGTAHVVQAGGTYTAVVGDRGTVQRFTAAGTLAITSAATLGAGYSIEVVTNGGAVTIDPAGSETINGLTTMIMPDGTSAKIICDGTNFQLVFRPGGWQSIELRSFSAVSAIDFTNLGAFSRLRLTGLISLSSSGTLAWRTSTNNGSSYDSGASDYSYQGQTTIDTTLAGSRVTGASFGLLGGGGTSEIVNALFVGFGVSGQSCVSVTTGTAFVTTGSTIFNRQDGAIRNDTVVRNALRIIPTTAITLTGTLLLEGSVS